MKYIFQYGELDSTKIIEEITKTKKKLVNIISYFSNKNTVLLLFIKNPPRRRLHFSLLFTIREADVITSFYQVTAMEQLDTLIFDAIIKLKKFFYFTVSDDNTDHFSINSGLLTTESVKEIFKEMFKEQQNALVNIVSQNTAPLQTSLDK